MRAKAMPAATESAASQNDPTQTTVAVSVIFMMEFMPRKRPIGAAPQVNRAQRSRSISEPFRSLQDGISAPHET